MALDPTGRDCMPLYHAGQIQIYRGNKTAAEELLAKAVEGHFSPLLVNEEEVFHDYGLALWFAEKPMDAITNFEKSLAINGTFTKGLNNLGCALGLGAVLGKLPQQMIVPGIQQLQQAVSLSGDSILYWRNLVALLRFANQDEAAASAYQQLVALDPHSAQDPPQDCSWEFSFRWSWPLPLDLRGWFGSIWMGLLPGEHLGSGRINKMLLGYCLDDSCCHKLVCDPGMGLEGGPVPASCGWKRSAGCRFNAESMNIYRTWLVACHEQRHSTFCKQPHFSQCACCLQR